MDVAQLLQAAEAARPVSKFAESMMWLSALPAMAWTADLTKRLSPLLTLDIGPVPPKHKLALTLARLVLVAMHPELAAAAATVVDECLRSSVDAFWSEAAVFEALVHAMEAHDMPCRVFEQFVMVCERALPSHTGDKLQLVHPLVQRVMGVVLKHSGHACAVRKTLDVLAVWVQAALRHDAKDVETRRTFAYTVLDCVRRMQRRNNTVYMQHITDNFLTNCVKLLTLPKNFSTFMATSDKKVTVAVADICRLRLYKRSSRSDLERVAVFHALHVMLCYASVTRVLSDGAVLMDSCDVSGVDSTIWARVIVKMREWWAGIDDPELITTKFATAYARFVCRVPVAAAVATNLGTVVQWALAHDRVRCMSSSDLAQMVDYGMQSLSFADWMEPQPLQPWLQDLVKELLAQPRADMLAMLGNEVVFKIVQKTPRQLQPYRLFEEDTGLGRLYLTQLLGVQGSLLKKQLCDETEFWSLLIAVINCLLRAHDARKVVCRRRLVSWLLTSVVSSAPFHDVSVFKPAPFELGTLLAALSALAQEVKCWPDLVSLVCLELWVRPHFLASRRMLIMDKEMGEMRQTLFEEGFMAAHDQFPDVLRRRRESLHQEHVDGLVDAATTRLYLDREHHYGHDVEVHGLFAAVLTMIPMCSDCVIETWMKRLRAKPRPDGGVCQAAWDMFVASMYSTQVKKNMFEFPFFCWGVRSVGVT
jgi:hypothetical protein